ncbi:MAG: AMP-binding protein [Muribaculaceae bacterium]|nr:AMP-binding protein [Muribaculaceae bacterium]
MTFEDFFEEWKSEVPYIEARTSGSTGEPKIIRLSKDFVKESALRTNRFFSVSSRSRLHSCVSADFIGGKMMAVRSELAGCRFSHETPSNRPLGSFCAADSLDLVAVVPSQLIHILDNIREMPSIGAMIIGGSAIDVRLRARVEKSGLNAYETYGMTETSSHIALRKVREKEDWFETLDGIKVGSDSRGCLVIRFSSGEEIVTNDLAQISGDRMFKITGRWDHVIITGGKKVNPYDVERKISMLVNAPYMITSRADLKWGRMVVLLIEGSEESEKLELLSDLKSVLDPWEVPKVIEWVRHLPRTANGKLKR